MQSRASSLATAVPAPRESGPRAKCLDASPLRLALLETGTSEQALARRLGCSRALVRKFETGEGLTPARCRRVVADSPRVGRALLGILRAQLEQLDGGPASEPGAALPALCAELGDVGRVLQEIDADGERSHDELVRLDRELAELEEVVRACRRWVAGRLGA